MILTKKKKLVIIKIAESSDTWYSFRFTSETAAAIETWITALLSGTYTQGRYSLHNLQLDSYCCLGVLREISSPKMRKQQDRETTVEEDFNDCLHITKNRNLQKFFIHLNDDLGCNFFQIAEILENIVRFIKSNDENMEIENYVF